MIDLGLKVKIQLKLRKQCTNVDGIFALKVEVESKLFEFSVLCYIPIYSSRPFK